MLKTRSDKRRQDGARGAVAVEAGLILPLLMFMVFGIIELGSLLSTYSAAANGVRAGGRMASVQGSDSTADQATLARIAEETTAIGDGEIEFIIIWEAASSDSTVPAGCLSVAESLGAANTSSQGIPGTCNVYAHPQAPGGAFDMASGAGANPPDFYFGCLGPSDPSAAQKVDCRWPAGDRETSISPRGTPAASRVQPDYLGVYIRVEYEYLTGLLGATRTINDNSITLLEPDSFGVGP